MYRWEREVGYVTYQDGKLVFPLDAPAFFKDEFWPGHAGVYRFRLCENGALVAWYIGESSHIPNRLKSYQGGHFGTDRRIHKAIKLHLDGPGDRVVLVDSLERPKIGAGGPPTWSSKSDHRRMLLEAAAIVEMQETHPGAKQLNRPKADTKAVRKLVQELLAIKPPPVPPPK